MYNQDGQIPGAFTAYQQQQLQQQQQQAMSMDGGGGHYNSYQAAAALAHHQVWPCLLFHAGGRRSKRGAPQFLFGRKQRVFNKRAIESSAVLYGFLGHSTIFMG